MYLHKCPGQSCVRAHDRLADVLCVDETISRPSGLRPHVGRALVPELILFGDCALMSRIAYRQLKRSTKSDSVYDPPTIENTRASRGIKMSFTPDSDV